MAGNVDFLGAEFLTWLWFATEETDSIELPDHGWVKVTFTERLWLASASNENENSVVKSDVPLAAEEARTALRIGKQVNQARLLILLGEEKYELQVVAGAYTFTNVAVPSTLGKDDPGLVHERLLLIDRLENVVDGMYQKFMKLRSDPDAWALESEKMHAWVKTGANA